MAVFDTNYYMTLGAALATGKEEPSGKDIKEFAKKAGFLAEKDRLSAIQDRRKQYEVIMSALSEENFDRMKLSFKYQQERNKIISALTNKALDANQTKSLITALEKNQAEGEKILEDLNDYSWPELDEIIGKSADVLGGNRPVKILQTLTKENAYKDGKRIANPQNLAQANSIRKALSQVTHKGEQLFKFDELGVLTNYDELSDPQTSPLRKLGISDTEIETVYFAENNIFDEYNKSRKAVIDDLAAINGENSKIRLKIEQLKAARDPQEILRIRKEIADGLTMLDEVLRDGAGMELEDVEQLGEELEIYEERRANAQGLKDEIEQLSRTPKSEHTAEDKQLLSKMEKRAANPYIREWAADHGFDEMGTVSYDENGQPIPGTYAPGRDDAAIAKTFQREFNRCAGRYGFRSIGSGDIVQFQHEGPDGEVKTLVGERLKYHAADRGAVRVAVPGIEEPVIIPRGSNTRIVVLERKPDKMSPLARRAKGLMFRRADRIESLSNRFKIDDRSESVARDEEGRLFLDKATGRYIEQSDFDESLASKMAETEFVGKLVGDKQYVVDPNGNVFAMDRDSDGNLKLNAVEDEALLGAVNAAESRAVTVINVDETGEEMYSPLTQAALDSGEFAGIGLSSLESDEGGIPEDDIPIFAGVAKQRRTQALQGMNVELTDEEYDPLKGRTKNEQIFAGNRFVELDGDPQAIQEYNEVEQVQAQQEGRSPELVEPPDETSLEEIEASTADEAADTAAPENQADARSKADKLAEVLAEKRAGDDRPDVDLDVAAEDPVDLEAMSDEEAKQRVEGTFKPGATEFTDTDEIAGVPSDIGSIVSKTLRSDERERGEDDPPKLPSLQRGIYEGKGGYKYEVDFNGNITIVDSPRGRGRGAPVKPGTAAHRAVVTELSQGPAPQPKALDMAQITPLLASIGASTVKAADAVGEVEPTPKDEVTEAAGTPASGTVPGQQTDPQTLKENKEAMKDLQEKRRPALEQGVYGRKEKGAQTSAMFQNMLATTNTDVEGINQ